MNQDRLQELYGDLADKLTNLMPYDWTKVYLYAEVSDSSTEAYFYYKKEKSDQPIYVFDVEPYPYETQDDFDTALSALFTILSELRKEFVLQRQPPWTNMTFKLDDEGNYDIHYDYSDLSEEDRYEQHIIWRYKVMGVFPLADRKDDVFLIERYIAEQKEKR